MIVTGTCIILEDGEYNNIKFIENRPIFELNKIERLLPLAKRVVYDAISTSAVNAIITSSASKKLCYPAMKTTGLGSVINTCTKRVSLDEIMLNEFMSNYKDVIENNYEKPSAKLLTTLVNRTVVAHHKSVFSAHVWCGGLRDHQSVSAIDVTPRSTEFRYKETEAYAASSSIMAADMASLSDALYKEGWLIQSFANGKLVIGTKDGTDCKEVEERTDRAKAIVNKAIGMHSKYDYYNKRRNKK